MGGLTQGSTTTKQQWPNFIEGFGKDFFKDAKRAFNKGPYYYKGSTVTPFSDQSLSAFGFEKGEDGKLVQNGGGMLGLADANSNGAGMSGPLQQIMNNGGFNASQMDSMASIRDLTNNAGLNQIINDKNGMTAAQNKAFSGLQNTVYGNNTNLQRTFDQGGLTADQQSAADFYRGGMNEEFGLDPAYQSVKQQALASQNDALSARAAAAGRYGGGMDQAILAREQGNLSDRMDTAELDKYRARRNAAAGSLAGLSQQGIGNQLGINSAQQAGLGSIADMGAMGVGQRNTAIGTKSGLESTLFNMNASGLDNMGKAYDTALKPFQTERAVGAEMEDLYTRQMQDKLRKFDAQNPFNHLQQYGSLLSGAPTNTVQTSMPSTLQTLLGAGIGGYGLLSGLGMF